MKTKARTVIITRSIVTSEKKKKKIKSTIKQCIQSCLLALRLSQTHSFSKSSAGFRGYTPTGILIFPQKPFVIKKQTNKKPQSTGLCILSGWTELTQCHPVAAACIAQR